MKKKKKKLYLPLIVPVETAAYQSWLPRVRVVVLFLSQHLVYEIFRKT